MNPIEMVKGFMTKGMTPKGIVKSMVGNNPIFNNLIEMAEKGDEKGVETFARNMLKERNLSFDEEFKKFMDAIK
jgi:hypothetical protein